jgi:hypothetical protein
MATLSSENRLPVIHWLLITPCRPLANNPPLRPVFAGYPCAARFTVTGRPLTLAPCPLTLSFIPGTQIETQRYLEDSIRRFYA